MNKADSYMYALKIYKMFMQLYPKNYKNMLWRIVIFNFLLNYLFFIYIRIL